MQNMAEEGTVAVLEPDTGTPEASPVEESTAAPLETGAPTEAVADTEAQGAGETAPTEGEQAPAPLSEADIERAVTEARTKWEAEQEDVRATAQRSYEAQRYQESRQQAQQQRQGKAYTDLFGVMEWVGRMAEEGQDWKSQFNGQHLNNIAGGLLNAVELGSWEETVVATTEAVDKAFPGYQASTGLVQRMQQAVHRRDKAALLSAQADAVREAYEQTELPKQRAAWKKDFEAQQDASGRLDGAKAAQEQAGRERPTNITAGVSSVTTYNTKAQAAQLYTDNRISAAEYRAARDNPNLPD